MTLIFPNIVCREQATPVNFVKDPILVDVLGPPEIPSDTGLVPKSAGLLQCLEKRGEIAVTAGETTNIWTGTLNNNQDIFKSLLIYPLRDLWGAKKVFFLAVDP